LGIYAAADLDEEPMMVESDRIAEAEPGMLGLWRGILIYRWTSLAIMVALSVLVGFARPVLGGVVFAGLIAWNVFTTRRGSWDPVWMRTTDLGISAAVMLVAPFLVEADSLVDHPFVAAAYPLSSVLTWAAATGLAGGSIAAFVLWVPLILSRPLNGLSYEHLAAGEILSVVTGCVYYVVGAITIALFARTLDRSAEELRRANEVALREHERAARLAERETLSRALHDSVLQTLAIVIRRGRELTSRSQVPRDEVGALVGLVEREEQDLRVLLRGGVQQAPGGAVALRTVLEAASFGVDGVPITITTVEPAWVAAQDVSGLTAAIRQGLENAAEHAQAGRVTLFGECEGDELLISVRDDGVGFDHDEERLRRDGRLGISESMRGRIEDLGGRMRIDSAPGHGTKVEFRLPVRA
jgi:signal transduction histidine kinase